MHADRPSASPLAIATLDVRNIHEARECNHRYDAVVTAGPDASEVRWGHPNHVVEEFDDVTSADWGPQLTQVEFLVSFGARQSGTVLVHCHAGVSRSTATAWGIAMARGADPATGLADLMDRHPVDRDLRIPRPFFPNARIVDHLVAIFDDPSIRAVYLAEIGDDSDRWW